MFTKKWIRRIVLGLLALFILSDSGHLRRVEVYADCKARPCWTPRCQKLDAEDPTGGRGPLCQAKRRIAAERAETPRPQAAEAYELIPESYKKWNQGELKSANETPGVLSPDDDLKVINADVRRGTTRHSRRPRTLRQFPRGGNPVVYNDPIAR